MGAAAGTSPRSRPEGEAGQQHPRRGLLAMLPGAHRRKQHVLATTAGQPPESIGAGWETSAPAEPPLLPSASLAALPGLMPQGGEEEDTVLIGSTAPSFCQPHAQPALLQSVAMPPGQQQQHQEVQQQQQQQHPLQAGAVQSAQQQQQAQHSRRASLLPHGLDAEDLSLAALAAASRRGTRYSSAASMPSTGSSAGDGDDMRQAHVRDMQQVQAEHQAAASAQLAPVPSSEVEPLAAGSRTGRQQVPRQQLAARLSSEELAILRLSLVDLQLDPGTLGSSPGAAGSADIPDQLVLQALSSRLGRLDSQKRRVLLEVLARIEELGQASSRPGACNDSGGRARSSPATAEEQVQGAASQLMAESLQSSRRASAADGTGLADAPGPAAASLPAELAATSHLPRGSTASDSAQLASQVSGGASQTLEAEPHHNEDAPGEGPAAVAVPPSSEGPSSPSKALAGKLAALRTRSGSFAGRQLSGPGEAASGACSPQPSAMQNAAAPADNRPQEPEQQQAQQAQRPQAVPEAHAILVSSKLQPMVQQRHRERSRLSVDGLRGQARQRRPPRPLQDRSHLSPAAPAAGSVAADALSAFAAEHQSQQHPEAAAAASPAAIALRNSMDPLAGPGDSLELLGQPSELDLVTAASPSPLSARGQLPRTTTLPVLPHPRCPPSREQHTATAAHAAGQPSPDASPAALVAACSRGSTAGSAGGAGAGPGPGPSLLHCRELTLVLLDTWGDCHFVGLSGLQLLGPGGQPLPLAAEQLSADPPDLNCFSGHSGESWQAACDMQHDVWERCCASCVTPALMHNASALPRCQAAGSPGFMACALHMGWALPVLCRLQATCAPSTSWLMGAATRWTTRTCGWPQ